MNNENIVTMQFEKINKNRLWGFAIAITTYFSLLVISLWKTRKYKMLLDLLKDKIYLLHLIIILGFTYYVLKLDAVGFLIGPKDDHLDRLKDAVKKGFFGLLIALFAYIDVTLPVYWAIVLAAFYFDGYI